MNKFFGLIFVFKLSVIFNFFNIDLNCNQNKIKKALFAIISSQNTREKKNARAE